jgi:pimeloyl-ACP methyl ester carboxylesterase
VKIYFLQGLAAGGLAELTSGQIVWVDATQLAAGRVGKLRLAADGRTPGAPDGVELFGFGPLRDYYGAGLDYLGAQLAQAGGELAAVPFDWRLRAADSAALLAARVRDEVSLAAPCTLIGHSFGGLVARFTWRALLATGDAARVRRIITIGTPHWGSYASVLSSPATRETLAQLSLISTAATLLSPFVAPGNVVGPWDQAGLVELIGTFPSFYECLPNLAAPAAAADPSRVDVFTAAKYVYPPAFSQALLDEVRAVSLPLLADSSTIPPPWVLTCVGGTGVYTPYKLLYPSMLGEYSGLALTPDGDGTVTLDSAVLPTCARFTLISRHMDLFPNVALSGALLDMVLDPRSSPAPAPAAAVTSGSLAPTKAGPPFASPAAPSGPCGPNASLRCC